ncbi:MAG: hypothetical protein HY897_19090 [Deltaproteobacteria bacterium]|nr:hypothetical protein [Deltaproteobacteria bacterium]
MDAEQVQRELAELKAVIEVLDRRVARLEHGPAVERTGDGTGGAAEAAAAGEHSVSTFFARLAAVCFALVGALILRVAAQHGWIDATFGTWFGLAYCATLIGSPFSARVFAPLSPHVTVLQYCGVSLVPLLVLETFHKTGTLGGGMAAAILVAAASAGGLAGSTRRLRALAAAGLLLPLLALAGLGPTPDGAALRAAGVAWCAALAFLVAHRRGWGFLRPLVVAPACALLGLGVVMTARRTGLPAHLPPAILGASAGLFAVVGSNHAWRWRALGAFESALFPLAGAWAYCLLLYYSPEKAPFFGLPAGAGALALAMVAPGLGDAGGRAFGGAVAASALTLGLSLPSLDSTGIGLAVAALAIHAAGRSGRSGTARVFSQLLAVEAAAVALTVGRLYTAGGSGFAAILTPAAILAVLLVAHYRVAGSPHGDGKGAFAPRVIAPISLVAGLAVFFFALRGAALLWLGRGPAFGFSQTLVLAAAATGVLCLGAGSGTQAVYYIGLGGAVLAAAKVVFWDLATLEGSYLLASVVTLGVESVIAALAIRRRAATILSGPPAAPTDRI